MTDYTRGSELLKALAHPVRLRMVAGMLGKECNVTKMVHALKLPQSTVSQHLGVLRRRGIVAIRKEGVRTCYRVADPRVGELVRALAALETEPR